MSKYKHSHHAIIILFHTVDDCIGRHMHDRKLINFNKLLDTYAIAERR